MWLSLQAHSEPGWCPAPAQKPQERNLKAREQSPAMLRRDASTAAEAERETGNWAVNPDEYRALDLHLRGNL
ncbi:hypothetical protein GCM10011586_33480 [Silvibacterium dinghuense]|nr:hypothetical protein GCM10011586_33480 [Silvibacterium dinghuense]